MKFVEKFKDSSIFQWKIASLLPKSYHHRKEEKKFDKEIRIQFASMHQQNKGQWRKRFLNQIYIFTIQKSLL